MSRESHPDLHPLVDLRRGAAAANARRLAPRKRAAIQPSPRLKVRPEDRRTRAAELQRARRLRRRRQWNTDYESQLNQVCRESRDRPDAILSHVCLAFNVTREQIESNAREDRISEPRIVLYWLLRRHTDMLHKQIARLTRRHNHSTPCKCVRNLERRLQSDASLRDHVVAIDSGLAKLFASQGGKSKAMVAA